MSIAKEYPLKLSLHYGYGMSQEKNCTKEQGMGRIGERPFWVLNLSIVIRALHQVGAAVFLTTFLIKENISLTPIYLYLVFLTGFALIFTEWLRHRQVIREVSGVATSVKLVLLGAAYHQIIPMAPTVVFIFLLASIFSHAPKKIRHKLMY